MTNDQLDLETILRPSGSLLQASTALGRALEESAVTDAGRDPTTLDLLVRLRLSPERELRGVDLCRQLLKSPGYVSRIIDRAEGEGFVQRRPDPEDRRAQRVTLTEAGEAAVDAYIPHLVRVLNAAIYDTLEADEIETLIDLLSRIAASAHSVLSTVRRGEARRRVSDYRPAID